MNEIEVASPNRHKKDALSPNTKRSIKEAVTRRLNTRRASEHDGVVAAKPKRASHVPTAQPAGPMSVTDLALKLSTLALPKEVARARTNSIGRASVVSSGSDDSLLPGFRKRCATIETDKIRLGKEEEKEQVNQYSLLQVLGKGQYGTIRLCKDTRTGQSFACKCLSKKRLKRKCGFGRPPPRKGKGKKDDGLQDLKREVAILKAIDHPHIVKLYEVMDDPEHDIVYMIFELLNLGCVMDMTNPETVRTFSEEKACVFFRQLVLAIEFLHYHKVIHRDIKPSNLLLCSEDAIKVADFGVSHIFDGDKAQLYKTAGTPAFMAPEAINVQGCHYDGEPVDIWAMGVTLHCFLFGKTVWSGETILDLHRKIREEPPNIDPSSVSFECLNLFSRLLQKDPAKRITIEQLRSHPWVTRKGTTPLPSYEENCVQIDLTPEEVETSVTNIQHIKTLVLVKKMLKNRSFGNPNKRRATVSTATAKEAALKAKEKKQAAEAEARRDSLLNEATGMRRRSRQMTAQEAKRWSLDGVRRRKSLEPTISPSENSALERLEPTPARHQDSGFGFDEPRSSPAAEAPAPIEEEHSYERMDSALADSIPGSPIDFIAPLRKFSSKAGSAEFVITKENKLKQRTATPSSRRRKRLASLVSAHESGRDVTV